MFLVSGHDAPPLEHVQKTDHCFANHGHAANALIAPPGDDQDLLRPIDLVLAEPRLDASDCSGGSRQCFAEVERA